MALVVQNDTGEATGANGYISVAEFKAYHDTRGNVYVDTDALIQAAIVKATDYIDTRFRFRGVRLNPPAQTTQWPRKASKEYSDLLVDVDGESVSGIPLVVKNACAEYALRAMTAALFQDAPAPEGGIPIVSMTQKVDVIEQSVQYLQGGVALPVYPAADLMLERSGLLGFPGGKRLYR